MTDVVVLAAFALLALGVVGSVAPAIPGPLLSLSGVLLYWWSTGYTSPGTVLLAALLLVGIFAIAVDVLAGVFAAKAGGASTPTAIFAGIVGVAAFFVAGPPGMIVAVAATVFVVVFAREGDASAGGRAALITTVGILGSAVVQVLLTLSMLVAMAFVVL